MSRYVLGLDEVDQAQVAVVGGKGANLGALRRMDGVRVPPGFCVTTDAFRRAVEQVPSFDDDLAVLAGVDPGDRAAIRSQSEALRRIVEEAAVPPDVVDAITEALGRLGGDVAWAVRSSATAEDLPGASFAGQHDSHLGVVGPAAVVERVRGCWASLFTERAVTYRLRHGVDAVQMAVVVQRMVDATAAGVAFSADPLTGNRTVTAVEAVRGLGDALVSGEVNPDVFRVRDGVIVEREVGTVDAVLTDGQVLQLAGLVRRIEAHLGSPQDVEWCLDDDGFHVVQSRPITTLFPIPEVDDGEHHVYVSVGHQQMMTDPIKPLGISVWQLTAGPPMREAGSRLFVDVTARLASPAGRVAVVEGLGRSDPLIRDALETVLARGDFVPTVPDDGPAPPLVAPALEPADADEALIAELTGRFDAAHAAAAAELRARSGTDLLDGILDDIQALKQLLFDPRSLGLIMVALDAVRWLNEHLEEWLGEKGAADVLAQSVPHNVTSEMGLALLDVADAVRPHPEVVAFLRDVDDDGFLDRMAGLAGGPEARDAIQAYLDRYGMRCVGEIDITRPRWSERPRALLPMLLANVDRFEPGEARRRFERGRQEAADAAADLLARLRALPDGERKAAETEQRIDLVRRTIGYREQPKYTMISRYGLYKEGLVGEARRLVDAGVLQDVEDAFFLTFQELHAAVRTGEVDRGLVARRKEEFGRHRDLTPPRVLTSEGEALAGSYRRGDVPVGALVGLAVSRGTVEGRARVIHDMAEADVEPGDILVTAHTDPSWSPLFVAVAGVVTEVGGLTTHGAVVAREYGLPAVVGVERATQLLRDGQRIRVDGTNGYVEVLDGT